MKKKIFYGIILKKTFFKIAGKFDKYKKIYYNIIGGEIFSLRSFDFIKKFLYNIFRKDKERKINICLTQTN